MFLLFSKIVKIWFGYINDRKIFIIVFIKFIILYLIMAVML